ncbi:hypothetical protein TRIP_B10075 [uncultured Desulfatiglans sp.]|uniref:Uncharacterized protein n=1 Tax=Uncultured Desulfatiglans sp. TaxID=1748965 RepID=A0A652ZZY1_UNCDX|nr:hypothetical protein TRIP_B10075 [uncultured Desulfatiglans sp.]
MRNPCPRRKSAKWTTLPARPEGTPHPGSEECGRLLMVRPDLFPKALEVFLVLEDAAQGLEDDRFVEIVLVEGEEGLGPVERLGDPRFLQEIDLPDPLHEAGDLLRETGLDVRHLGHDDGVFLIEGGVVDPVVEAAPLECVVDVAGPVGGDDDHRALAGLDGPHLRDRDLEVGENFQQKGLELFIRPVDLVDEEDGRVFVRAQDGLQQGAFNQEFKAVDRLLDLLGVAAAFLLKPDVHELFGIVPLVEGGGGVQAFVALEADQIGLKEACHDDGDLRFPHPRLPLEEDGLFEAVREIQDGGKGAVCDVAGFAELLYYLVDVLESVDQDGFLLTGDAYEMASLRGGA